MSRELLDCGAGSIDDYLELVKQVCQGRKHLSWYLSNLKRLLDPSNPSLALIEIHRFMVYDHNQLVGHIAAMVDPRLHHDGRPIGLLGFYACIDDDDVASLLFQAAFAHLRSKGCHVARGPVDLSIWHGYRFPVDRADSFLMEPLAPPYYIGQWTRQGFTAAAKYCSAERTDFDTILEPAKKDYASLVGRGISIRQVSSDSFEHDLGVIYDISSRIFQDSWSFVHCSREEFLYLYKPYKGAVDLNFLDIASHEGKDIGFCFSIPDPVHKEAMILKTIAVLPEYQSKGVGASLLYQQHRKALEKGFKKFLYALIRVGNTVTKLPYPGASLIAEYIAMEKIIG